MAESDRQASEDILKGFEHGLGDNTNFTIQLDDYTWRVHGQVLAEKSGFFEKICTGNSWKEGSNRLVILHDDAPPAFARLIQFMYYGVYFHDFFTSKAINEREIKSVNEILLGGKNEVTDVENPSSSSEDSVELAIEIHLMMYDLADKYDIQELRKFALDQFVQCGDYYPPHMRVFLRNHYPERAKQDYDLHDAIARLIAKHYDYLVYCDVWTQTVGDWLKNDWDLSTKVMKYLRLARLPDNVDPLGRF